MQGRDDWPRGPCNTLAHKKRGENPTDASHATRRRRSSECTGEPRLPFLKPTIALTSHSTPLISIPREKRVVHRFNMGVPSFQASNAIIYITYGAFLSVTTTLASKFFKLSNYANAGGRAVL